MVYAASRSGVLVLATTNDSATSPRPLEPSGLVAAALPILVEVAQVHQHCIAVGKAWFKGFSDNSCRLTCRLS